MRLYEIVYIFDATLDEDSVNKKLEKLHPLVVGKSGEIVAVDHWGIRQMAYPVKKQNTGYYVVSQVRAEVDGLPEFERILTLDTELLRYLIVLNEGEPTTGHSLLGEAPPSRANKDDDDDDDDDRDRDRDRGSDEEASSEEDGGAKSFSPPEFSGGRGRRRRMEGPVIELLNYKDVSTLSQFMTEQGKILPKRTTKVTARFQRQLGRAIKRARFLALIPYIRDHEV